jgi:hypothetical protein
LDPPTGARGLREYVLVCKNWKGSAQSILYFNVKVSDSGFDSLTSTIASQRSFGKMVKRINMNFIPTLKILREANIQILHKVFPYLEYIYARDHSQEFYLLLLYAGLDSKLKYLKYIDPPNENTLIGMYIACALVYRNTLTHLTISDELEECEHHGGL